MRASINYDKLSLLGARLKKLRELSDISQKQIEFITGMDQSHLSRLEAGQVNVSINYIFIIADFYGLDEHELLNFKYTLPSRESLVKNILRYLKKKNIDRAVFFKTGLTAFLEDQVLTTKFLSTPRYAKEIADFLIREKFEGNFSTSGLSQALDGLQKKGLIEKVPSDKRSKFQYKKL